MRRVLAFEPGLPTRVLADHRSPPVTTNAEFFDREGTSLLTVVFAFVLMITDRRAPPPEQWCADAEAAARWVRGLCTATATVVAPSSRSASTAGFSVHIAPATFPPVRARVFHSASTSASVV